MDGYDGHKTVLVGLGDMNPGPVKVPNMDYVLWLEEKLQASRETVARLNRRLEQHDRYESRRSRYNQDYLPYDEDDR